MRSRNIKLAMPALLACSMVVLSSCGGGDSSAGQEEDMRLIHGQPPTDECVLVAHLWDNILDDYGYEIEHTALEPAALYAGFERDQVDLNFCGIPETHQDYWDSYGEYFESATVWSTANQHGLIVPDYVDAESVEDLEGRADEFNNRIIGIEPGSGLMQKFETVYDYYNLDGFDLLDGSSPAMVAELERAINSEENIVVAGWEPHWIWNNLEIRMLDDPAGGFDPSGTYNLVVSDKVSEDQELMDMFSRFEIEDEVLYELLDDYQQAGGQGNEEEVIESWLETEEAQELVDSWVE